VKRIEPSAMLREGDLEPYGCRSKRYITSEIGENEVYDKLKNKDKKMVLFDVRSREAYKTKHIKGALSIPLEKIENNLKKLDKNKEIVLYCDSMNCGLDRMGETILKNAEYENVRIMNNGIAGGEAKGYPVIRGRARR
jgi:rhodanese-related sulfurtransferase